MCKAPKPPAPKDPKKPQFLKNRYLDEFIGDSAAVNSLRTGRSSLRIPQSSTVGAGDRVPGTSLVNPTTKPGTPTSGDANTPPARGDFRPIRGRNQQRR